MTTTIDSLTAALLEARATGTRISAEGLPVPTYAEALAVQSAVQDRLGAVAGFKVAQRADGPPVIAPIPAERRFANGARIPLHDLLGIELEVGFEVMAPPGRDPMAAPEQIFRPRVVLELVDSRLTDADDAALLKLADMQINDGIVLGPAEGAWDGRDFGTVNAQLTCGSQIIVDGPATVPGGSALASLGLLCQHLGDHCGGLQPGQILITGSISGLLYFPAGTDVTGCIDGLGTVRCQLG